jgi:hypothetical protein
VDKAWGVLQYLDYSRFILIILLDNLCFDAIGANVRVLMFDRWVEIFKQRSKPRVLGCGEWQLSIDQPLSLQTLKMLLIEAFDDIVCDLLISKNVRV